MAAKNGVFTNTRCCNMLWTINSPINTYSHYRRIETLLYYCSKHGWCQAEKCVILQNAISWNVPKFYKMEAHHFLYSFSSFAKQQIDGFLIKLKKKIWLEYGKCVDVPNHKWKRNASLFLYAKIISVRWRLRGSTMFRRDVPRRIHCRIPFNNDKTKLLHFIQIKKKTNRSVGYHKLTMLCACTKGIRELLNDNNLFIRNTCLY